jgi:hypothetical protein
MHENRAAVDSNGMDWNLAYGCSLLVDSGTWFTLRKQTRGALDSTRCTKYSGCVMLKGLGDWGTR